MLRHRAVRAEKQHRFRRRSSPTVAPAGSLYCRELIN
jgi:hypothetical protein